MKSTESMQLNQLMKIHHLVIFTSDFLIIYT